ncbi:peptide ABC transporter substrate-binding protein [Fangia hongkongensis]|uniref:peptide ABC transporter substrate-binding protein n=1 Tax=Fangia hongkongensis TaxID=270495 RepID=UPI0003767F7B|nr:peptide ABC transporter substrate-binding protein [Fangia hongkongensis]MBK2125310.1 peptide ABC transporter substrate-binding protein [Fangia hongkongensis]
MNCVKNILRIGAGVALALSLVACGSGNKEGSSSSSASTLPAGKSALNVALGENIPTIDPALISDTTSARVAYDLFEGLISEDQNNNPVPGVAKSWKISDDGLVYTFFLREDAKWSNGKPVTAEDFVFALERSVTPKTTAVMGVYLNAIKNATEILAGKKDPSTLGVKAINKTTLEITLAHPQPFFLSVMAQSIAYPVYPPVVKKYGKSWILPEHIVTNGAYKLKTWVTNGVMTVVKNPYYWDAKNVKIETVHFYPIASPSDAYNQYRSGRLDMTYTLPQNTTSEHYKKQYGDQFVNVTQLGTYFYWMNVKRPGLDKLDVRKALTMSIDRKAIVNHILQMGQTPLYGIVPDGIQDGIYADLYKKLPSYNWVSWSMDKRDQEARKLLEKAGYSKDNLLEITISYNTDPTHLLIVQAIAQMWNSAFDGAVKVKMLNEEWKVYLQTLNKGNFEIARQGWIADYNTASNFVSMYVCGSSSNRGQFCNKKLDQYYYAGMAATNTKVYDENMAKAMEVAMNNYYTLPVYNYSYFRLVKPYVGGYDYSGNHLDHIYSKWLYFKS